MEVELWKQILTGAIVVLVFVALFKEWFSPDLTAMSAFILLVVFTVLEPGKALAVFGSSAPITVAAARITFDARSPVREVVAIVACRATS